MKFLGVSESLDSSSDYTWNGFNKHHSEADEYLKQHSIDINSVDSTAFYEVYIRKQIAASMGLEDTARALEQVIYEILTYKLDYFFPSNISNDEDNISLDDIIKLKDTYLETLSYFEDRYKAGSKALDAPAVQEAFQDVKGGGDYDGWKGLQCVDLSNWYIDTYTTLKSASGNGNQLAAKIADANHLPLPSSTPTAPAVYSVAGGTIAFGNGGNNNGHTGIVLAVDKVNMTVTVIETRNSLNGLNPNSVISTYSYPADGVTFTDLSGYLK
jgi:CHAP domain.